MGVPWWPALMVACSVGEGQSEGASPPPLARSLPSDDNDDDDDAHISSTTITPPHTRTHHSSSPTVQGTELRITTTLPTILACLLLRSN